MHLSIFEPNKAVMNRAFTSLNTLQSFWNNAVTRSMMALVIMLVVGSMSGMAQNAALTEISGSIKSGNAKALSSHFDATVEVTILDTEGSYSRSQAELVVRNFFTKNEPRNFRIIHKGESGGNSKYAIGKLETSNGTFRTYIYVKNKEGKLMVQQLRFESE